VRSVSGAAACGETKATFHPLSHWLLDAMLAPLQVQTGEWEIRSEYFCARLGAAARLDMLLVRG
jgi:hypothetical protein